MEKISLVILAAGKGTRFLPLTITTPKPMLRVAGKPALQHQIDAATPYINEVVIVVGYLQEKIKEFFGESYNGIPIKYVNQEEALGSGDALRCAQGVVTSEKFFLIYGDDIYHPALFEKVFEKEFAAIGMKVKRWQSYGIFQIKESGHLDKIVEKPSEFVGDLANIGVFKVRQSIFNYFDRITKSERGELELTDIISLYANDAPMEIVQVEAGWLPLGYPWHLLDATEEILRTSNSENKGTVESGATLNGNISIGEGTVVKAGSYIEGNFFIGKNCVIGPNCYLKGYGAIGDSTEIGVGVEICRSIIGSTVDIKHLAFIGDSILGNNINIAAGTVIANLKLSNTSVKMSINQSTNVKFMINDQLVDSGRRKLGAIIGDGVKTGINTSIYPGRKLWNDVWTLPSEVVDMDKK